MIPIHIQRIRDLTQPLLAIPDLVDLCGVGEKTVRRWIEDGRLVACKLGGQWRLHPQDYAAFLDRSASRRP